MQADQAAGLRNKHSRGGVRVLSLFETPPSVAPQLARALQARHHRVLLVDSLGRHARASRTQSIFGWEQQAARQRLQTITVDGVDVLHAPGAQAGDMAITQAAADYDYVLFDGATLQADAAIDARTPQTLFVALSTLPDRISRTYALIKTLHENRLDWRVLLLGESTVAERLVSATDYFLRAHSKCLEQVNIEADAHLTALAAKISAAEIGTSRFYNNAGGEGLQHG